ncbi:MAG: DUF4199 domain-containing protein [Bacteroidia bacterium]|nr:DUF4199 domain-containing protein [Bacteroidia bacterium]NNM15812.1 DUF4199 domain-containing protein [Bacteroidia bacterium]
MNLNQSLRLAVHYGSISALCSFGVFLLLYFMVKNPLGNISFVGAWIPIVFIVLAIKSFKENVGDGYITYGQGLRTGTWTSLFIAILFSLLVYIFLNLIDASIIEAYKEEALKQLEISKDVLNKSMYYTTLEGIEKTTAGSLAMSEFYTKFIGGFIVSLIVAAFFKSPKPIQN